MINNCGVIFDLDGLLVNSEDLQIEAEVNTLISHGVNPTKKDIENGIGKTITDWAKYYLNKYPQLSSVSIQDLLIDRESRFFELAEKKMQTMPGADNLLKLVNDLGFKVGLASSNYNKHINFCLDKFNWRSYFQVILGEEDVNSGKPAPDLFLKASKLLKLSAKSCLVFEDSLNGMLAANKAGCFSVVVSKSDNSLFNQANQRFSSLTEPIID